MQFQSGQSGNPAGRPPGSRNKKTLRVEAMLDMLAEDTVKLILARAHAGEPAAMRLCMAQMAPGGIDQPLELALPPIDGPDGANAAADAVVKACETGTISPRQTVCMLTVVERRARIAERAQQMKDRHEVRPDVGVAVDPAGASNGAALYSPVNSRGAEALGAAAEGSSADAEPSAAADDALYFPVNSSAQPAVAAEAEGADVTAGTDAAGLYSPVNPRAEPTPGAADAALADQRSSDQ